MAATDHQQSWLRSSPRTMARLLLPASFWVIVAAAAASVLSERALPLAIVLATTAFAIRWIALGAPAQRTPLDWPITALAAMAAVTLWITPLPAVSWVQVARLMLGFALCYAVADWVTPARYRLAASGLAAAGLVLATGALVSVRWETYKFVFLPPALYEQIQPRVADVVNPNVMAGYLALLLPCVLGPLFFDRHRLAWYAQLLSLAAALGMLVVLLLTQSRAGMLAAALGLCGLGLLRWGRSRAALLGLAGLALMVGLLWPRLAGVVAANVSLVGGAQRVEIWQHAMTMLRDHALTGIGMGSFNHVLNAGYPLQLSPPDVPHAHNLFLQVALDLGLPGLIAWLAALGAATYAAWQAFWRGLATGDGLRAGLAAGLLGAQLVLVTHGMLDAVFWGMVRPAVLVWALWGVAVALQRAESAPPATVKV